MWDALIQRHLDGLSLSSDQQEALQRLLQEVLGPETRGANTAASFLSHEPASNAGAPSVAQVDSAFSTATLTPVRTWSDDPDDPTEEHEGRYEERGLLGQGGMGEVRRVYDRSLGRTVALKAIRRELMGNAAAKARFQEEARITARLDHPGIAPVHELGELPDGRPYYTMKEMRGQPLGELIRAVHEASPGDRWESTANGWTFRRLVAALRDSAEAVAYAHARKVIHRDLKPANILCGAFGEVLVADWGLARSIEKGDGGLVAGTPAYMAPEQAHAGVRIGPTADVFSLGAILFEILLGVAPRPRDREPATLARHLDRRPWSRRVPAELRALVLAAMSEDPADRPPQAGAFSAELSAWLEGARKRDQALELVAQARATWPTIVERRAAAAESRREAARTLSQVSAAAAVSEKRPAWELEDQAAAAELEAELALVGAQETLGAALNLVPELDEAHRALAELYAEACAQAEARGDTSAAARAEALLRAHDTGAWTEWLEGGGAFSLVTSPPGAEATLYRYETIDRRLQPVYVAALGPTPILDRPLPRGSYRVDVVVPGFHPLRYPLSIGRGERWTGAPPGQVAPQPIPLMPAGSLGPNDVYVPAGWFWSGSRTPSDQALSTRRLWIDGLVFQRCSVTNREFIQFLDERVDQGAEAEALRHAPRERGGTVGDQGALIYGRDAAGHFVVRPDADGDVWELDWAVMMIDWEGARAYADWRAQRDGLPWRLPHELEWEKAARGVDGRVYPWGGFFDATWARLRSSPPAPIGPRAVGSYPVDESPYGVNDMAGGMRDWCENLFRPEGPPLIGDRIGPDPGGEGGGGEGMRSDRGGSWADSPRAAVLSHRDANAPSVRSPFRGLRLCRSLPPRG